MSTTVSLDAFRDVTASVLEEASFVFTEEVDEANFNTDNVIEAKLVYHGPEESGESGEMALAASSDFSIALAANLLGIEEDDPTAMEKGKDAICELINMICGAVLAEWFGADGKGKIGLPSSQILPKEEYEKNRSQALDRGMFLSDEGERIDFTLYPNRS